METTKPITDQPAVTNDFSIFSRIAITSSVGYLATKIFTAINPIAGAIFSSTTSLLFLLVEKTDGVLKKYLHPTDCYFLKLLLSASGAFFITKQIIKISVIEALKLTALPYITGAAILITFAAAIIGIGGIGLAIAALYDKIMRSSKI